MKKVKLEIIGLSYSQTQSGAYALVLSETDGQRRLPIIIGGFEAQAIAIELENMKPSRPLTHDLVKNIADTFGILVKEIVIHSLREGIFYSKLICESNGKEVEIDARTSDAIALAVRFKCPVYTYESILSSAGIRMDQEEEESGEAKETETPQVEQNKTDKQDFSKLSIKDLEKHLEKAVENEDYEMASKIRDEINKRTS
ncbi:MAG: bifunctional nuclease family protein [Brumimicrobium sp.]|nr:bifunctional nuclease family protein [Brumimicrobium sp.]MCO5268542.1 bifunctional nuclease family protein [Brumimicrobium sp.]